jgi:NAD(P)-dependent dehydrogenase (short-subunit alcohol dehydrogenase family)
MGRIALITGGAQGIGAAAAAKLLREGFGGVLLLDRNAARLEQEAAALRKFGQVETLVADLREDATPARAVAACVAKFGRIDLLLNAAGDVSRGGVADTSLETYHRLFDINVKAPLFLMQEAAKVMQAQKSGTIINVASMIAQGGPPHLAIYGASKAALVQLTKHAAHQWAWDGIRSFAINLGWAFTEGEQRTQTVVHAMPENWSEIIGAQTPAGRLILPSDIADLVYYLTSPSAQMMNGSVIDFEQLPLGAFRAHPILKS